MKITKKQYKKIEIYIQRAYKKNKDPYHDLDHAVSVSKTAVYIARQEKADVEVCRVAGLLHDIAPKTRGKTHGVKSGNMTRAFLRRVQVEKEFINNVYQAIIYHDTSRHHLAKTLEAKIVFEADKLETIGPVGLIREYGDLLSHGYAPQKALAEVAKNMCRKNPIVHTKTAKKLQKELLEFNKEFIRLLIKYRKP